jgi:hypothetical protein
MGTDAGHRMGASCRCESILEKHMLEPVYLPQLGQTMAEGTLAK